MRRERGCGEVCHRRRSIRLKYVEVAEEPGDAGLPGKGFGVGPADRARDGQGLADRRRQIFVEASGTRAVDDVQGAGHRIGGDVNAGGEGFEEDEAERVGPAGKDNDVSRRIVVVQALADLDPAEADDAIPGLELRRFWGVMRRPSDAQATRPCNW